MKWKTLSLFVAIALVVLCAIAIGFAVFRGKPGSPIVPGGHLPSSTTSATVTGVDAEPVTRAFLTQIQNADKIQLEATRVADGYALQGWGDENKGGDALLKYTGNEWLVVTMGGGAWDEAALVSVGVPEATAKKLLAP